MLCLFFGGCNIPQTPKSKLVTEMTVLLQQDQERIFRHYTDPQKMETVLCYLRALKGHDHNCGDPEQYGGTQCRIELYYSDGSKSYIFQCADRFLSRNFGSWQEVDPKHGAFLLPLVKNMHSD